jgi:4-hydroxy-tetrahydrodipicolinate synthase
LSSLVSGAAGVMAGTANVVPAEIVAVYDAVRSGDLDAAREAWARVYPLLDAALSVNFIAAVKVGLDAVGFPAGSPREPVLPLDPEDATRITELASVFRPQPVA